MKARNNIQEILPQIKLLYPHYSNEWIAKKLNTTAVAIKTIGSKYKLKKADDYVCGWLDEDLDYLKANFRTVSYAEIAKHLGKKTNTVASMAWKLGLKRTEEEQKAIVRKYNKGCFSKENVGFRPPKGIRLSSKTEFKKGQLPKNTLSDGVITIRHKKGDNHPYQFIRIGLSKWVFLHRHIWQQANGPIPKDSVVIFKDGNTLNCVLDNLEMITKAENARRNVNYDKSAISMRQLWADGKIDNGMRSLDDNYIARMMAGGDQALKAAILENPELIELKRTSLHLNRAIKNECTRKA
jgi:hypothetical protein